MKRHEVQERCDVMRRRRERKWEKILLREKVSTEREEREEKK